MEIINLIITGNYIVPFLIAITVLVFVHEMGHFLAARRAGVDVQVFSVGIGPKLFGRVDRHGTLWQVAALPIGGYVKMRGQSDVGNDVSADTSPGSFVVTSLRARAGVVFAGPLANFVLAFVLLFGLYVGFGQYTPSDDGEWVVIQLVPGAPAERAGILPNDKIHSINGKTMQVYDDLINAVRDSGGDPVNVSVSRQNGVEQIQVQPAQITLDDGTQVWRIGLAARQLAFVALGPIQAVVTSFRVLYDIIVLTLSAVGEIIIGERSTEELGGPIRIAELSTNFAQQGFYGYVVFLAALSLNLGIINLFPLPVLDGGHLLFYGIEAIRGRPLSLRYQLMFFRVGIVLLLTFMLFVTYQDLLRLF